MARNSLNDVEKLVESPPHGPGRGDDDNAEQTKSSNARGLLLLADNGEAPGQVIMDPEGTMDEGREKQATAGPTMDKIESFVAISGAQKERKHRVFGRKEEDDRQLSQGDEAGAVRVVE